MAELQYPKPHRKVVVVGAGAVGSTYCYSLAQSGMATEIVLIDKQEDLLKGQVMDLAQGMPFFPAVRIRSGDPKDYTDAHVVVITAGAAQKEGETRLQLLEKNAGIVGGIAAEIAEQKCPGVIVVTTNPVDVMTQVALRETGWKRGRVIGSGTVLDSARLRHLLSVHCKVDVHNVHAYVLGEHGDTEFAAWSMTNIAGMGMEEYCTVCGRCEDWKAEQDKLEQQVRESAYQIINRKGSTHFAVGLALVRITGAVLRGSNSILTVSTLLEGEYGLEDVCLSVPALTDETGVIRIIESQLSDREMDSLRHSASVLREAGSQIGLTTG